MNTRSQLLAAAVFSLGGLTLSSPPADAQISTVGNVLLQQGVDGIPDQRSTGDRFGTVLAWGDFNGDGFEDLAIGIPDEDAFFEDDGMVQVLYGGSEGLGAAGEQRLFRAVIPDAGIPHAGDRMGHALASGDFESDDFDDLAIGIPGDEVGGEPMAGSVLVLYGAPAGLRTAGAQLWNQASAGIGGAAESGDAFGSALAVGKLDGDVDDDLAVGVPFEAVGDQAEAGVVHLIRGSSAGLQSNGSRLFDRGSFPGPPPDAEDRFGAALAAGDFNLDGIDDLAVGAPGVQVGTFAGAGEVYTVLGQTEEPVPTAIVQRPYVRCEFGAFDDIGAGDRFGSALASIDLDGDGDAELAIGIPGATIDGKVGAGQVDVLYPGSLEADCWNQTVSGVGGGLADADERFGASLAAGDLTGDGVADLVVGVPGQRLGPVVAFGGFHVFHGSPAGLAPPAEPFWNQDSAGVPDGIESGDAFGFAIALGDANGDGVADLAVGVPGEEIAGAPPNHGAVHVFYNSDRIFADGFESGDLSAWGAQP